MTVSKRYAFTDLNGLLWEMETWEGHGTLTTTQFTRWGTRRNERYYIQCRVDIEDATLVPVEIRPRRYAGLTEVYLAPVTNGKILKAIRGVVDAALIIANQAYSETSCESMIKQEKLL